MTDSSKTEPRRDWFAVERRVFEDQMFAGDEFSRRDAWIWLIANAAIRDHHTRTRAGVIALKRGEVIVAAGYLAKAWGWTRSRVRTYLDQLHAAERIDFRQSDGHYPKVARINNYGRFQDFGDRQSPVKSPVDRQSVASGSPHLYKEQDTEVIEGDAPKLPKSPNHEVLHRAMADFNRAAELLGFSRCTTPTDAREKALAKRLRDLGAGDIEAGGRRFREALSAIPHWPFLAGRVAARPGQKRFRLDLDRLLSTGSGMGDVLAKLCDLHDTEGPAEAQQVERSDSADEFNAMWADGMDEERAAQRARFNGIDGDDHEPVH